MKNKVLIIEDDTSFGTMLQSWFVKNGFEVFLTTKIEHAKKELLNNNFNLIFSDLRLPDGDGILLLSWIKEQKIPTPVIIMTSYADVQSAVNSIKLGAFDYLEKPINPSVLKQKIEQALNYELIPEEKPIITKKNDTADIVYGNSMVIKNMYEHIKIVAPTRMSVLITGESGTGKEYAARMIHMLSPRKDAQFIAVDCGSLSKELAPSELFGHLKGSFTSAVADKKGVFEQADKGTVFLDEIGNLSYDVQVQLLRAIQELKIRPVGSATDIRVDIRIIVATNENLEVAITEGRFREDLYHRLNEFSITVPPLRERVGDIIVFANYFLNQANEELGKSINSISDDAVEILNNYHWNGNLRELRNVIRRAVLFAGQNEITPSHLPATLTQNVLENNILLNFDNEKEQIINALKITKGNKAQAARLLKIDRKTLYNKMHQYGLEI